MSYFKDPFENIKSMINQLNEPFNQIQQLNLKIIEPALAIQNQMALFTNPLLEQHNAIIAKQNQLFESLTHIPFENLHSSYQSLVPMIEQLNTSLKFNPFDEIDFTFLQDYDLESNISTNPVLSEELKVAIQQEVSSQLEQQSTESTQYQQQSFEKFLRSLPLHVTFIILSILYTAMFGPIQDIAMEKPQDFFMELWEDKLNKDFTEETQAMIRKDTFLRSGKSKYAPLVLPEKLVTAQPVLKHTRKKNWLKISVEIDGVTYTGWVEKSKVVD